MAFVTNRQTFRLGTLPVTGRAKPHPNPIQPLESNDLIAPQTKNVKHIDLILGGGAMNMSGGMMRKMMGSTKGIWTINKFGISKRPWAEFKRWQTAIITMLNDTQFFSFHSYIRASF